MSSDSACFSLVLHAHLPYVRHPEQAQAYEESWLFEAITECYLPLLRVFNRLADEDVKFRLNLSLSPPLISMLRDELLLTRYLRHLRGLIKLAEAEIRRSRHQPELNRLARFYRQWLSQCQEEFSETHGQDLLAAFQRLQQGGYLELMTSAATHAYLPLLRTEPLAVRAQLQVAADFFRETFGHSARGVWLPECGYYPGLEQVVKQAGFEYFILETHGLLQASPPPARGIHAAVDCGNGVAAFARDPETSRQVWSADSGYPGDPEYREFHRDIGFELSPDYLARYLPHHPLPGFTGLKYWRITGDHPTDKALYCPERALARARLHARHFLDSLGRRLGRQPGTQAGGLLSVSPYDAELFGHWWFEGPPWLEQVLREAANRDSLRLLGLEQYLDRQNTLPRARPALSSWGRRGYHEFWLNPRTDWIYPRLRQAARRMEQLARDYRDAPPAGPEARAVRQAARCLLLAQSSDWPFIMTNRTGEQYASQRITDSLARFHYLDQALARNQLDLRKLRALEILDPIFPNLDYRWFMEDSFLFQED